MAAPAPELPDFQILPGGAPPSDYPEAQPLPDLFSSQPDGLDLPDRRQVYFQRVLSSPAPRNTKAVYYELARMQAGGTPYEGVLTAALDYIDARQDCADFILHGILRLLFQFPPGSPGQPFPVPCFLYSSSANGAQLQILAG